MKCDGTRAETTFRLSAKRTSPFKSSGASVHLTSGSRGVRISGSNAGYTMFRGSVKSTGYPLHSPVSPSLLLPCVTVCHHITTGLYLAQPQVGRPPLVDSPRLFIRCIFAATLHFWRPLLHPQPESAPCCGDRDPLIMDITMKNTATGNKQCDGNPKRMDRSVRGVHLMSQE